MSIAAKFARRAARAKSRQSVRLSRMRPTVQPLEDRHLLSIVLTTGHTDVTISYDDTTGLEMGIHYDVTDQEFDPSLTLFYAGSNTKTTQPNDPKFAFEGAGAGGKVWVMPQTENDTKLYLGFGLDGVDEGVLDNYFETDPRINAPGEWLKTSLIGVQGPGQFSMWQTDSITGDPIVWMSTYDPLSQDNAIFNRPGGDNHVNWGFTAKGCYDVSLQTTAYLNGNQIASDVVDYQFGVQDLCTGGPSSGGKNSQGNPVVTGLLPAGSSQAMASTVGSPSQQQASGQTVASAQVSTESVSQLASPATPLGAFHGLGSGAGTSSSAFDGKVNPLAGYRSFVVTDPSGLGLAQGLMDRAE
jgi:surface-anchored protein